MKAKLGSMALLCITLGLVGCDHATKLAASSWLVPHGPVSIVSGWVDLRYAENRDVAFSLTRPLSTAAKPFLLAGLGLALLAGLFAWGWRRRDRATITEQLSISLVAAGALGNVIDRLARGFVVDFIHVHYYSVFNVADVLIVAGVAGLFWTTRARRTPAPV